MICNRHWRHVLPLTIGILLWLTPAATAFEGTVTLPLPSRHQPSEAHIAINPAQPSNALVVARDLLPRNGLVALQSWATFDGGASWTRTPLVQGSFNSRPADASDPVVAYSEGGSAFVAGLLFTYGRRSWSSRVVVNSSSDGGHSFPNVLTAIDTRHGLPGPVSLGEISPRQIWNDKEWIAVDRTNGPFAGSVYLAWDRLKGRDSKLVVARLPSGAGRFSSPVRVESRATNPQLAVRPDGTVDLVWTRFSNNRGSQFELRHAISTDGGASYTSKKTIAKLKDTTADPATTLTVDGSGVLLACWSGESATGHRTQIDCTRSVDGILWSTPAPIDPGAPKRVMQLLPAATSQGSRFWLMGYLESLKSTRVVLYRSDDGGASFSAYATLAKRSYGFDRGGFVGDYLGLAATSDHVLGAYVLAKKRALDSQRVYVSALATP